MAHTWDRFSVESALSRGRDSVGRPQLLRLLANLNWTVTGSFFNAVPTRDSVITVENRCRTWLTDSVCYCSTAGCNKMHFDWPLNRFPATLSHYIMITWTWPTHQVGPLNSSCQLILNVVFIVVCLRSGPAAERPYFCPNRYPSLLLLVIHTSTMKDVPNSSPAPQAATHTNSSTSTLLIVLFPLGQYPHSRLISKRQKISPMSLPTSKVLGK